VILFALTSSIVIFVLPSPSIRSFTFVYIIKSNVDMELRKSLEEPSTPPEPYSEELPSTSGEFHASEVDFFVPVLEAEDDVEDLVSSFGGDVTPDTMPRMKCVVCSALKPYSELRAMWKDVQKNMILLACLLLEKSIAFRTAVRLHYMRSSLQKFYCNVHFVDAARFIEKQLKKRTACFFKDSQSLLPIPAELLNLLMKQALRIDKNITLHPRVINMFYRECVGKFHDGNDWIIKECEPKQPLAQTSDPKKRTRRSRKRFLEGKDDEVPMPAKTVTTEETEGSKAPRCGICWETQEDKLCEDFLRPPQRLILLTCLVLYNTTYFEVAKSMLREAEERTLVCKSHFIMAMFYMYQYVKKKWNHTSTTFSGLGDDDKLDLFNHINTCALRLQEKAEISKCEVFNLNMAILDKFYNCNERKYNLAARLKACKEDKNGAIMDIVRSAIRDASQVKKSGVLKTSVSLRRKRELARDDLDRKTKLRRPNVFKSIAVKQLWSIKRIYLKDFVNTRVVCELCGSERFKVDARKVSTKTGRINVLLACLLKQALVDEKTAKSILQDGGRNKERYLCHEHFIHAGAYLGAAVCELIGYFPTLGLCCLPIGTLLDIVDTLQEQLNSIVDAATETDIIVTQDVILFFGDFLSKYVENSEWEIAEFPPFNMEQIEAAEETQLSNGEDNLFSNDVNRDGVAVKEENEKQASIAVKQETSDDVYSTGANVSSQSGLFIQEAKLEPDNDAAVEDNADMELGGAGSPPQSATNVEQETYTEYKADSSSQFDQNVKLEKISEINEASSSVPDLDLEQKTSIDSNETNPSLLSHYVQMTYWTTCSLCAAHRHKSEFLGISLEGRSGIILLSCMVINGTCDLTQAKKLIKHKRTSLRDVNHYEMCKWHFSVAGTSVFNDYKQLRLEDLSEWLYDVPVEELIRRQKLIQTTAEQILTRCIRIGHANIRQFSAQLKEIVSGQTHQEKQEEFSTNQQIGVSETDVRDVIDICDETSPVKPEEDTVQGSIQPNNHEERAAFSAVDEEYIGESASHQEVSAVALMEQPPIPDVDGSLGTSGATSKNGAVEASSGQLNDMTTELQSIALFHFQRGFSVPTATAEIVTTFGDRVVNEARMEWWYKKFREKSAQSVAGGATPISQKDKKLIKALLRSDPVKPVSELAEEFGASVDTVISCLQMGGIPKNFKKTILSERQQRERLETCSALIMRQSREHDFMERIVTYGEIWLGGVDGSYPVVYNNENAMLGVWWTTCGVVHYFLLPAGYKMTANLYISHLNAMHKKLLGYQRYRTLINERGGLLMLLDSRLPYMSLGAFQALHQNGYEVLPLPEICYDLLPTEYHFAKRIRDYVAKQSCYGDSQLAKCINSYFQLETVHFYVSDAPHGPQCLCSPCGQRINYINRLHFHGFPLYSRPTKTAMIAVSGNHLRELPRSFSHVVVGVNNVWECKKLFKFLRLEGYNDVALFHDYPEVKGKKADISSWGLYPAPGTAALFDSTIERIFSKRRKFPSDPTKKPVCTDFTCALCGRERPMSEARRTAKEQDQSIIFLASLYMADRIDVDQAIELYSTTRCGSHYICQEHYVKAAAFIGQKIKKMHGKFPAHGLHNVSIEILEAFMQELLVFAEHIDKGVVLESHEVIKFFNDCLARYEYADGWDAEEMYTQPKRRRNCVPNNVETFETKEALPTTKILLERGPSSPLFETKDESLSVKEGISAALLLQRAESKPGPSTASESTSTFADEELAESENDVKPGKDNCELMSTRSRVVLLNKDIMDALTNEQFRERFRLSRRTFKILCEALWARSATKSSVAVKIAAALDLLAGASHVYGAVTSVGTAPSETFDEVLDALFGWSGSAINWPADDERNRIETKFFEMTGLFGIVGCLGGTTIMTQTRNGSKALNVGVVVDNEGKFRWVVSRSEMDDELVFKRSLLCEQLKNGTKRGCLIGSDAYKSEPFLLTPRGERDCDKDDAMAVTLRKAHQIVDEAISNWKLQFPILTTEIKHPKVARIILGSAAIYNLTRAEGEPPFQPLKQQPSDQPYLSSLAEQLDLLSSNR
ncbi:unnamed protein product, partial [Cylicocyclus nassatus]